MNHRWIGLVFLLLLFSATALAAESLEDFSNDASTPSLPNSLEQSELVSMTQSLNVSQTTGPSPKQLKAEAIDLLKQNASASRSKISSANFNQVILDLNRSANAYLEDGEHVWDSNVFSLDAQIMQNLEIIRNSNSDPIQIQLVESVSSKLWKADSETSMIQLNHAIQERGRVPLKKKMSASVREKINQSNQLLKTANNQQSKGKTVESLKSLQQSWAKSYKALVVIDQASRPIVTAQKVNEFNPEGEPLLVKGTVYDTFWYAIQEVSVENGPVQTARTSFDANQEKKSFSARVPLQNGTNAISVSYQDKYGNLGQSILFEQVDGDGLPQWYEEQVTKTSASQADSDADGLDDGREDLESDDLTNFQEFLLQTNPMQKDSDGDGLLDGFEAKNSQTNANLSSSDSTGISDAQKDPDGDQLTNLQEQSARTDALSADSDQDTINDSQEVKQYHSNPNSTDSDQDGLADDSEIKLGTQLMQRDSDGDGIPDGSDTYHQTLEDGNQTVVLTADAVGDLAKNSAVSINNLAPEPFKSNPDVISTSSFFFKDNVTTQQIEYHYTPTQLNGLDENQLMLVYYNPQTNSVGLLENQAVDKTTHTITGTIPSSAQTTSLSIGKIASASGTTQTASVNAQFIALVHWPSLSEYNAWNVNWVKPTLVFKPGDKMKISVVVKNIGQSSAASSTLKLYKNKNQSNSIGTATIPSIAAGAQTTVTYTWTVQSGTQNVCAYADSSNIVVESVESNNANCLPIDLLMDSDGDGLTDYEETNGMKVAFPQPAIKTNPNSADTDGDGLSDGEEMGLIVLNDLENKDYFIKWAVRNGVDWRSYDGTHYTASSDPTKRDTDGDGKDDRTELIEGTQMRLAESFFVQEAVLGFITGDFLYSQPPHDNDAFLGGWIISGFLAFGDIRDALYAGIHLDGVGLGLSLIALVPAGGDASSVGTKIFKHLMVHTHRIVDALYPLMKSKVWTKSQKLFFIKGGYNAATKGFEPDIVAKFVNRGVKDDYVITVVENRGNLAGTLHIITNAAETRIAWLEKGFNDTTAIPLGKSSGRGWRHIYDDHVRNFVDKFGANYDTEMELQELVKKSVQRGTFDPTDGVYYLKIPTNNEYVVKTVVGENGYIVTSFPFPLKNVPITI